MLSNKVPKPSEISGIEKKVKRKGVRTERDSTSHEKLCQLKLKSKSDMGAVCLNESPSLERI